MNCIDPVLCNFVLFAQFCFKRNVISLHSSELSFFLKGAVSWPNLTVSPVKVLYMKTFSTPVTPPKIHLWSHIGWARGLCSKPQKYKNDTEAALDFSFDSTTWFSKNKDI